MSVDRENIRNDELADVLKKIEHNPPMVRTYGMWNAGYFSGERWGNIRPDVSLTEQEARIIQFGRNCLETEGQLTMVGLGEMVGYGLVTVASAFRGEVLRGDVNIIVTNLERDFDINSAITESKRRLAIFGSLANYERLCEMGLNKADDNSGVMSILRNNRLILNNHEEVAFLEENHHLVRYISGVETMDVPYALSNVSVRSVNVIHERMGAFAHSTNKNDALSIVPVILSPNYGVLLTATRIDSSDFRTGFQIMRNAGIHAVDGDDALERYNIYAYTG